MMKLYWVVPLTGLLALGCGDADGLHASGSVALTVHQAGQQDGAASFDMADGRYIDTPTESGQEITGTCQRVATGWSLVLTRTSNGSGLQRFSLTAPLDNAGGAASTISFTLGTSVFENVSACAVTAMPSPSDHGVRVTGRCTGLTSTGDPRTADANLNLTFWNCTGY